MQEVIEYVQKHIVGKLPSRDLSRKKELAKDEGIDGGDMSPRVFTQCNSRLGGRHVLDTDMSIARSMTLTIDSSIRV